MMLIFSYNISWRALHWHIRSTTEKANYSISGDTFQATTRLNRRGRSKFDCAVFCVLQPLDYETKKAYTFKVDAANAHLDPRFQSFGAFKDTATVKINVLDVDEPPVFNKPAYLMDVYEDTPAGTIIGAVTAQDLDASPSPVR